MTRLIYADELEKKLARYFTGDRGGEATMRELITDETIADSIRIIREQPTVYAEPVRHGEWIGYPECLRYENALTDDDYACSCCGEVFSCIDNDMERFDYCPHCGAKMDAQEDGECQTGLKEH